MARIYQPLQRGGDKRWDMTVSSDDEGWTHAVGFCAGTFDQCWKPYSGDSDTIAWRTREAYEADREKHHAFAEQYHADGHATAAEAVACWQKYRVLLDSRVFDERDVQRKCAICGSWTLRRVQLGDTSLLILCDAHQSPADVAVALDSERRR